MTVSDYTYLLNRPDAVNDRQTQELEKIVNEFPFFQSARALRLKGLYNRNSFQYNYALKVTAAHTTDRSVLFDFITSDTFTAIHKGLYERKLAELYDIKVHDSEIIYPVTHADPTVDKLEQSILTSIRESEIPYDKEVLFEEVVPEEPKPVLYAVIDDAETEVVETRMSSEEFEPASEIVAVESDEIHSTDNSVEVPPVIETEPEPKQNDFGEITMIENDPFTELAEEAATAEDEVSQMVPKAEPEVSIPEISEDTSVEVSPVEEKLRIGRPLEFAPDEKHSFQEWLQLSKVKPIDRSDENESKESEILAAMHDREVTSDIKEIKNALIDRFIENNPKIPPVKQDSKAVPIPEAAVDNASLMTETLARVYLEQKKYTKAIQAYEILILKYPEKSSFFADRISEIRNLQQNNLIQ